jgi:hypothetical protein
MLSLAAGEITEDLLVRWIADHVKPIQAPSIQP